MANKKRAKKDKNSLNEVSINLSDLMRTTIKLMPQLIPIARQIADDLNKGNNILSEKKEEKKKESKKKIKLDSRHDLCKCGKVKLKISKHCRSCAKKK